MSSCCTYRMERESTDFMPLDVVDEVTGQPLVGYQTAVVKGRQRPTVWTPAVVTDNGEVGVILTGLTKGRWRVFVRAEYAPFEDLIVVAGEVEVS